MTGTPENPTQLPPIVIDSSKFVDLPDGSYLSDGHSPDFEGVYLDHLDSKDNLLGPRTSPTRNTKSTGARMRTPSYRKCRGSRNVRRYERQRQYGRAGGG